MISPLGCQNLMVLKSKIEDTGWRTILVANSFMQPEQSHKDTATGSPGILDHKAIGNLPDQG